MVVKSEEKLFELGMGHFCGFIIREDLKDKVNEILHNVEEDIIKLLTENVDEVNLYDWTTLKNEDETKYIHYYSPSRRNSAVHQRIESFYNVYRAKPLEEVYLANCRTEIKNYFENEGNDQNSDSVNP